MPKTKIDEPKLTASQFETRCKTLAVHFGNELGLATGEVAFLPEITSTTASMTVGGRASEKISRNRGSPHRVVPLGQIADDVFAWTGYRECWQKRGTEQSLRFVEAGFTLHIGRQGELSKPQVLRSEWVSHHSSAFVSLAGHPHWQLDVLESARAVTSHTSVRFDDTEESLVVREFNAEAVLVSDDNLLRGLTIERMHLPSAALWWQPSATVAHRPEAVADLDRWILGCVAYLRQEARRCAILGV